MTDYPPDKPQKLWHPTIAAALAVAMAAGFAGGGFKIGFERGFDHARIEYVDIPLPGPTVVKTVFVTKSRHCPSVANALNEYEAISRP
jgi:hypothetical protein